MADPYAGLDLDLVSATDKVLRHYDANGSKARGALQARTDGMFGALFGPGHQEMSALADVISNGRRELVARRDKVLAGTQDLVELGQAAVDRERDVNQTAGYAVESSLSDVLSKTATQSGQDVASGATLIAGTAGSFVLSAIPWWAYVVAGGLVLWKFSPRGRKA